MNHDRIREAKYSFFWPPNSHPRILGAHYLVPIRAARENYCFGHADLLTRHPDAAPRPSADAINSLCPLLKEQSGTHVSQSTGEGKMETSMEWLADN